MYARKTRFMLGGSILLAVVAAWLANSWVQGRSGDASNHVGMATTPVVVAAVEIPQGRKLEAVYLKTVDWPTELVPEGATTRMDDLKDKIAAHTIYAEDVITDQRVAVHLGGSHLAALIGKNKRAVAVRVDDVVGVAGFLLPGNHVDVIGIVHSPATGSVHARTVLRDVVVLAVDQDISPEDNKPKVVRAVTLELSPRGAVALAKASTEGKIQLALRNPADRPVTMPVSYKRAEPKARAVSANYKPGKVTVIRGTEISQVHPKT